MQEKKNHEIFFKNFNSHNRKIKIVLNAHFRRENSNIVHLTLKIKSVTSISRKKESFPEKIQISELFRNKLRRYFVENSNIFLVTLKIKSLI